jgi:hypothetical protein
VNAQYEVAAAVLLELIGRQERYEPLAPVVELARLEREARLTQCRCCGALIVFLCSAHGGYVAVNAGSVLASDGRYSSTTHIAHAATCPHPPR